MPHIKNIQSKLTESAITWPRISIVTPSFNQGQYIEETILSVLNQNYPNLEYIIIDGGSTDNTVEIIKKYESWISYWVSEKDNGQSHAINKGIEKCTGEIFNWLNSDDYYEPNALFEVARIFLQNRNVRFVSGHENHLFENDKNIIHTGTFIFKKFEKNIFSCEVTQPSTFFRLNDVKSVKGVSNELHYVMDAELWLKLILLHGLKGFKKTDKILVNFRIHESSKTFRHAMENGFLIERSSVIYSLQKYLLLDDIVIDYFKNAYFKSPETKSINTIWHINNKVTTVKKIKVAFIKKFTQNQITNYNYSDALKGISMLLKNRSFDFFIIKSIFNICRRKVWTSL